MAQPRGRGLVYLLLVPFLLSGAAALIAQLCWLRQLTVSLGGSSAALNITLIAFMAGLAIGARLARRVLHRLRRFLLLYAVLEGLLAVYILISPWLIDGAGRAYVAILPTLGHETLVANAARVLVSGLALLPPTILMGMTTPVLITASVRTFRETAAKAGLLYGFNTLGAAVGCFAAGTFLILSFGVTYSLRIAAGLNLVAAAIALLLSTLERAESAPAAESDGEAPESDGIGNLALLAGCVGFCAMALEVVLARLMVFMIGSSYYSHTIAITGFLLGIVLGSLLASLLARRFRPTTRAIPVILFAFGFSTIGSLLLFERLPRAAQYWLVEQDLFGLSTLGVKLVAALALVVVPAMISGSLLPYLIHLLARRDRDVAAGTSRILFANTLGSVAGIALTGYVLIETIGVVASMLSIAALAFVLGWLSRRGRWSALTAAAGVLLAIGLTFAKGGTPLFVHSVVYDEYERPEILFYEEDDIASVSVVEWVGRDGLRLMINGLNAAEVDSADLSLGATSDVALLSHPGPQSVFVAGVGSGKNAGVAGLYPVESVEAVEISAAVLESLPLFDPYTYDASTNPRIEMIHGDARHWLEVSDREFDVIVPDVFISALTGTAYLYNVEFFELCSERLSPGGRVVMNVSLRSELDRVLVASFMAAFDHVRFVTIPYGNYSYIIGSNDPIRFPAAPWNGWAANPEVQRRARDLGLSGGRSLADFENVSSERLRMEVAGSRLSTDDHPVVDYLHLTGDKSRALTW